MKNIVLVGFMGSGKTTVGRLLAERTGLPLVAMDAVMVDVTDVPGPPVDERDPFVLIGRQGDAAITVADVARLRTTNAWEVVTSMARRLPRVYHAASGPLGLRTLIG